MKFFQSLIIFIPYAIFYLILYITTFLVLLFSDYLWRLHSYGIGVIAIITSILTVHRFLKKNQYYPSLSEQLKLILVIYGGMLLIIASFAIIYGFFALFPPRSGFVHFITLFFGGMVGIGMWGMYNLLPINVVITAITFYSYTKLLEKIKPLQ